MVIEASTARREYFAGQRFRHGCGKGQEAEIPLFGKKLRTHLTAHPNVSPPSFRGNPSKIKLSDQWTRDEREEKEKNLGSIDLQMPLRTSPLFLIGFHT
jgi:hypothetical protein